MNASHLNLFTIHHTNTHKHTLRQTHVHTSWLLPCLQAKTTQEGLCPDLWHAAAHSQTGQSIYTHTHTHSTHTSTLSKKSKHTHAHTHTLSTTSRVVEERRAEEKRGKERRDEEMSGDLVFSPPLKVFLGV